MTDEAKPTARLIAGAYAVPTHLIDTRHPVEHCGAALPAFEDMPPTECVLRPGHQGSHANEYDTRWIEKAAAGCCPHCGSGDAGSTEESNLRDDLRARYAKAIYEHANPGSQWDDAHPDDVLGFSHDGQACLSVRDDELAVARARADQADAGRQASQTRAALFVERMGNAREWARRNLPIDQQEQLFRYLRGDLPTLDLRETPDA